MTFVALAVVHMHYLIIVVYRTCATAVNIGCNFVAILGKRAPAAISWKAAEGERLGC